jgi:nicotinamide-nucleotide amidase
MKFTEIIEIVRKKKEFSDDKAKRIITNTINKIRNYVKENNRESLVIGISGGLDSACVAALCQEKYTGVPLIGISIPMSSTNAHKEQAEWVGKNFCTVFEEFDSWEEKPFEIEFSSFNHVPFYEKTFNILKETNDLAKKAGFNVSDFPTSVLKGNMKARLRMITLYDLARKTNGMVLSTDNLSEFQMGFWTICGDVGDYGPIQNIGKGFELPIIAKNLGVREDIINQQPSDGLMVTESNTDEAQLGASYKEVDTIMEIYLGQDKELFKKMIECDEKEKVQNIINRYNNFAFKRNGTTNLTRFEIGIDS